MGTQFDIRSLTAEERLALLGDIWESLEAKDVPITDAQKAELDRRLDELESDPATGIPWEEVLRQIRERGR